MKIALAKYLGWIMVLLLLLVALGLYEGSFGTLRWVVFLGSLLFAFVAFQGQKRIWLGVFLLMAAAFNPLIPLYLGLAAWRVVDLATAALLGFFLWHYYDYYGKGYRFENYVATLFPENQWVIVDKTRDYSKKFKRTVESDSNPDFTFRHIESGKLLAVECKFRSYFYKGGVDWGRKNFENYLAFGKKNNLPVYIVVGVGSSPTSPKEMFAVPIEKLRNSSGFALESDLHPYKRDPQKPFFYSEANGLM